MTENELLYLGSTVAQTLVAALGLGAVFYVLLVQRAETVIDRARESLELFMTPLERAIRESYLLEGNSAAFGRFATARARERQLSDEDATKLSLAGNSIFWAGAIKRRTASLLRWAVVLAVPAIVCAVVMLCFAADIAHKTVASMVAVGLITLTVSVVCITAKMIWIGSRSKQAIAVKLEEPRPATAFFSTSQLLRVLHRRLFVDEPFGKSYQSIQALRRRRRRLYPVWQKYALPVLGPVLARAELLWMRAKATLHSWRRRP